MLGELVGHESRPMGPVAVVGAVRGAVCGAVPAALVAVIEGTGFDVRVVGAVVAASTLLATLESASTTCRGGIGRRALRFAAGAGTVCVLVGPALERVAPAESHLAARLEFVALIALGFGLGQVFAGDVPFLPSTSQRFGRNAIVALQAGVSIAISAYPLVGAMAPYAGFTMATAGVAAAVLLIPGDLLALPLARWVERRIDPEWQERGADARAHPVLAEHVRRDTLVAAGHALQATRRGDDASVALVDAIVRDLPEADVLRGEARRVIGYPEGALAYAAKAPPGPDREAARALALADLGRKAEARQALADAVAAAPPDHVPLLERFAFDLVRAHVESRP